MLNRVTLAILCLINIALFTWTSISMPRPSIFTDEALRAIIDEPSAVTFHKSDTQPSARDLELQLMQSQWELKKKVLLSFYDNQTAIVEKLRHINVAVMICLLLNFVALLACMNLLPPKKEK